VDYPDVGIIVKVTICDVDGSPEIVGLAIVPAEVEGDRPTIITADLIRRAPLRLLKRACLADRLDSDARQFFSVARESARPGRVPITRELLLRVADTYREAKELGLPAGAAIARVEGVSLKTADKYIRRARDEELLDETAKRREQP
jgi:hypothetical protein